MQPFLPKLLLLDGLFIKGLNSVHSIVQIAESFIDGCKAAPAQLSHRLKYLMEVGLANPIEEVSPPKVQIALLFEIYKLDHIIPNKL
jgi:hypothetical protein